MQRLIDANELKRSVILSRCGAKTIIGDAIRKMIDSAQTIDAEPHWIPCSERLPEVRQWVLCQCRAGIMDVLRLTENGSWYKGYPNAEYMGGFVVAWMPLPDAYEVKE